MHRLPRHALRLALALFALAGASGRACTIFVLTDANRALFFNNEDWFNPATRLWFVPAGKDYLGCAYLGFDNGWAQGGVNTAGLAFDWVSGFDDKYEPDPQLQPVRGNPSERMLESCTTVEEAIAFYRKFLEPDFKRSRILIADRSGASVAIGAREGKLHVVPLHQSRGFGYGRVALERELAKSPEPTVANGAAILRACFQPGDGGTKYSNVFDLKSGDIVLFPSPTHDESVTLNLAAELKKGGHYYEIAKVNEQVAAPPQPLLVNMQRLYLDGLAPIEDREPEITARLQGMIRDAGAGRMREADFAPAFWKNISPAQKEIQTSLQQLGDLVSLTLVFRAEDNGQRTYRYLLDFSKARVLGLYLFDAKNQIVLMKTEVAEMKPHASLRSN
ncbi:MAG TPA: hypothetical protein VHO24_07520 [Opitutaceae bacterium]|nr:hypothetical protein [Opitutaceae bacterium]